MSNRSICWYITSINPKSTSRYLLLSERYLCDHFLPDLITSFVDTWTAPSGRSFIPAGKYGHSLTSMSLDRLKNPVFQQLACCLCHLRNTPCALSMFTNRPLYQPLLHDLYVYIITFSYTLSALHVPMTMFTFAHQHLPSNRYLSCRNSRFFSLQDLTLPLGFIYS